MPAKKAAPSKVAKPIQQPTAKPPRGIAKPAPKQAAKPAPSIAKQAPKPAAKPTPSAKPVPKPTPSVAKPAPKAIAPQTQKQTAKPTPSMATKSGKSTKSNHIGSSRREAKATSKPSRKASQRAAQGIQHNSRPITLDPSMHAKKEPAGRNPRMSQVAVGTPNVPGYTSNVDADKYSAMKDIILQVMPRKAPGMTQGEMFDAVREAASHNNFPGSTHRWWAKSVQLDLESKGALVRETSTPLRWHLR